MQTYTNAKIKNLKGKNMSSKMHIVYVSIIVVLFFFTIQGIYGKKNVLHKNRNTITRYFEEVWNQGKVDVLDDILSSQYINHNPGFESPEPGPKGLKPIVHAIRKGFPDLKYTIEKMVVTEDYVAIHSVMTGTHTGDFFGIPATGKKIEIHQMQFEHIHDGKMIEHWRVTDDLNMMKQLGLMK